VRRRQGMVRGGSRLLAMVWAAVLLAAWPAVSPAESPQAARTELRRRLEEVCARQQILTRTLEETRAGLKALEARLAAGRRQEAALARQAEVTRRKLTAVRVQLAGLDALARQAERGYRRRLRALYLYGPEASRHLWATAADFRDALTRRQALTRLLEADTRRLRALRRRRAELARLQSELAWRRNELRQVRLRLQDLRLRLEELRRQRRALLAHLEERRRALETTIAALKEAEARLARTFALPPGYRPSREAASSPAPPPASGVLAVRGRLSPPVEGRVVARAGPRRRGVVIAARPEAPVRSPWAGTVAYAAPLAGYGRVVVIDHGSRIHTVLAHLGTLSVEKGQLVRPGQVVGAVDHSGRLYLEVRRGARPVDPLAWLRLAP